MDKVTVYQDAAGEFRWRRQSENGQVVSGSGEGYESHSWARQQAEALNPECVYDDETPSS